MHRLSSTPSHIHLRGVDIEEQIYKCKETEYILRVKTREKVLMVFGKDYLEMKVHSVIVLNLIVLVKPVVFNWRSYKILLKNLCAIHKIFKCF